MSVEHATTIPEPPPSSVPVGVSTIAGYGASAASALAFVLVLVLGVEAQQAALISTAAVAVISFAVTQAGRYAQAKAAIVASRPRIGA